MLSAANSLVPQGTNGDELCDLRGDGNSRSETLRLAQGDGRWGRLRRDPGQSLSRALPGRGSHGGLRAAAFVTGAKAPDDPPVPIEVRMRLSRF